MSRSGTPDFSAMVMRRASRTIALKAFDSARQFFLGGAGGRASADGGRRRPGRRRGGAASPFSSATARWRMDAPSKTGRRLLWALRQMFWWTPSRSAENLRPQTAQGSSPPGAAAVENAVVSAGGSHRFVRDAGRGAFGLNCVRKAAAAAWRGESGAGPDQDARSRGGRAREMGSDSARAAFAVSPFHDRRCSAALRGALHFSRCSSSSPCKIGLSPARIRHRDDAAAMACLRAIEESSEESTKIPGTPRRARRTRSR